MNGRVYVGGTYGHEDGYPPVRVPENRSSTQGVGDKTDPGWLAIYAALACCLLADAATLLLCAWITR